MTLRPIFAKTFVGKPSHVTGSFDDVLLLAIKVIPSKQPGGYG
jgi:hypothetical protein